MAGQCLGPYAQAFGKFPESAGAEEYEANVFGPGRRLVGQPTPQITLLATLQRVRPAAMARMIDRGTRASGVLPESARIASNRAATASNSDGLVMQETVPRPVG